MRRLADWLVRNLLRLAPWYRPEEIEAREHQTEKVRRVSINARIRAEAVIAEDRLRK